MAAHAQVAQSPLYQAAQQQAAELREQLAARQRERHELDLALAEAQHRLHVQDRQVCFRAFPSPLLTSPPRNRIYIWNWASLAMEQGSSGNAGA